MKEDITVDESLVEQTYEEAPSEAEEKECTTENDEREALLAQISALEEKIAVLEKERAMQERTLRELGEFSSLFPETALESIPDEVWSELKNGTSLAASYALYEAKCRRDAQRVAEINSSNASRSAGRAGVGTQGEYFSPDEVRRMSPSEVHANYARIKDSMKKWL